ncbi:MAG: hypothetical protein P9L99_05285 [Candidatus Lernaella stagnicola]|nr:hypothetical protein [Candidatus Lernaella stagnicola]
MKRKFFVIPLLVVAVAMMAAAPAFAQNRAGGKHHGMGMGMGASQGGGHGMGLGPFWNDPEVREKLDLSENQIAELEAVHDQTRRDIIELAADMQKARLDFQDAMDNGRIDLDAAKRAAGIVNEAHLSIMLRQIEHRAAVQGVLTDAQVEKLSEVKPMRRHRQRRGVQQP